MWSFTTEICYRWVRTHAPFFSADCWLGVIPGIEDKRVSAIILIFRQSFRRHAVLAGVAWASGKKRCRGPPV